MGSVVRPVIMGYDDGRLNMRISRAGLSVECKYSVRWLPASQLLRTDTNNNSNNNNSNDNNNDNDINDNNYDNLILIPPFPH